MDLQELISRGRFIFAGASERLTVYKLVDGRKTAKEIAKTTRRLVQAIHRDLRALSDIGLIEEKKKDGKTITKDGFTMYEKTPLARAVPLSYFTGPTKLHKPKKPIIQGRGKTKRAQPLAVPAENEILDICKQGEDQTVEFKAAGTKVDKITKEIAAMLNTRQGGIILYGVEDDGTIQGSDVRRQAFDQPLQNSVRNSIAPAAVVALKSVVVLGTEILVIMVPPWNRRDVYQYDGRILLRKGTNAIFARPEEVRKLHRGEYVV